MELTYRPINPSSDADVAAIVRWSNDPVSRYLWQWFPTEADFNQRQTTESVRSALASARPSRQSLFVVLGGEPVGDITFEIDPRHVRRAVKGTAWLGIVIGEPHARGQGIGRRAMIHLEHLAREAGACRAELGVFEFNDAAIRLYRRLGYTEFGRTPDFTWWNGRFWDDISMEKDLLIFR